MCVPQLTSVKKEEVATHSDTHEMCVLRHHSKGDSDDSKLLALAVQSLPAYVEMCCIYGPERRDCGLVLVAKTRFTAARLCHCCLVPSIARK